MNIRTRIYGYGNEIYGHKKKEYTHFLKWEKKAYFIAVPTSAGTGSESNTICSYNR